MEDAFAFIATAFIFVLLRVNRLELGMGGARYTNTAGNETHWCLGGPAIGDGDALGQQTRLWLVLGGIASGPIGSHAYSSYFMKSTEMWEHLGLDFACERGGLFNNIQLLLGDLGYVLICTTISKSTGIENH